ncbi:RNA polymerase sigma factor [Chitinophaga sancti]|uniref:RNA polymerase sigma factor n=1 Tax=Chitinophaga sancti TaxID=1004 RepID=UPI003F7A289E
MRRYSQLKDLELYRIMLHNSDHAAFQELHNRYWEPVKTIAIRIAHNANHLYIDDMIQETFLALFTYAKDPDLVYNFRALLFAIAKNKMVDYLKKVEKRKSYISFADYETNSMADRSTDSDIIAKELDRIIEEIKAEMPAAMRKIFVLSREEKLDNDEIAYRLDISPETVKNQLHKALKRLRIVKLVLIFCFLQLLRHLLKL